MKNKATRKTENATKAFIGLAFYRATTSVLNVGITDFTEIGKAWENDYGEPTISEFCEGVNYLIDKGIITLCHNERMLTFTDAVSAYSVSDLVTAANIFEGVIVVGGGYLELEEFFDDNEDMNLYALYQGKKFGITSLYNARDILFKFGLLRISADGLYIIGVN